MHGLILYCIEMFIRDRRGDSAWADVAQSGGFERHGFDAFRHYPPDTLARLIGAGSARLGLEPSEFLDDLGQWLTMIEQVRRILRFSGSCYADFILALEYLHLRGEMTLPGLDLPQIRAARRGAGGFRLEIGDGPPEWAAVICGITRAMADDFGALACVSAEGRLIEIEISDDAFSPGRDFSLTPALSETGTG
ncbi:MAG: heme NO-binding domain-containing protein [Paracoccus sp. (in: a-proteobacteria)]|nr:heme NO-binding domain-containing protein [Paracoccus sp. (in: a-proteobacteria)]